MVQIPTFTDLPSVAPARPEVTPQQGIDRFQRANLEEAGEGMSALGRGVDVAAQDTARIANEMAIQQGEVAQKTAATGHQQNVNNLGYVSSDGITQDGGFYSKHGQDAINALPGYLAAVNASQAAGGQGLSNRAKIGYDAQTQQEMVQETARAQRFAMVEGQKAATEASSARMGSATDTAVLNSNDQATIAASAATIHSEATDEARRQGWTIGGAEQQQYEAAHLSPMYRGVVEKQLASGNVSAAADAFNRYGQFMTPVDNVGVQERLKAPLLKMHIGQRVDQFIGPSGGGSAPYVMGSGYYDLVHGGEGNGVNPTTRAAGPVQVIPRTADEFYNSPGHEGVDLTTEAGGREFTKWYGDQNAAKISAVTGKPATNDQVVSAHLLGPGGATSILTRPNEPIGTTLGNEVVRNNPGPFPGGPSMTGAEAQRSIAAYYAKSRILSGPGAPPTAASVADEKPPRPDFEGAIARAAASPTPNDPDLYEGTIRGIAERKNAYDMGEAAERDNLEKTVLPQTMTALENGATGITIPELAIRRAFGPMADAKLAALNDARQFGTLANANKFAPPEDVATQRATLQARIGPTNTNAADAAQAVKGLAMLDAVTKRNDEALKADPFSYVRTEPGVVAKFAAATASGDPEDYAKAIFASEDKQRYLGANPQAISTQGLHSLAGQIHSAKVEDVPGIMSKLRSQYGSAWPEVFRDLADPAKGKLDPLYQTFATIPQSGAVPIDYAAALKAKADKGDRFGSAMKAQYPSAESDLENQITKSMADWQRSFQPGSGDNLITGTRNSIRTLATYYADDRGTDPTKAAKAAYSAIIEGSMTVSGNIRAPMRINGTPFNAGMVQEAGRGVQSRLTDADMQLVNPDGTPGVTAREAQKGKWVTQQDGLSAVLQVQNVDGSWRYARSADGKPITLDYRRLPAAEASPDTTPLAGIPQL